MPQTSVRLRPGKELRTAFGIVWESASREDDAAASLNALRTVGGIDDRTDNTIAFAEEFAGGRRCPQLQSLFEGRGGETADQRVAGAEAQCSPCAELIAHALENACRDIQQRAELAARRHVVTDLVDADLHPHERTEVELRPQAMDLLAERTGVPVVSVVVASGLRAAGRVAMIVRETRQGT